MNESMVYIVCVQIIIIIGAVIVTSFIVSWLGKCIANSSDKVFEYVFFEFSNDKNPSLVTNILMNIFAPIICMMILYDIYYYLEWNTFLHYMWIVSLVYFAWRMVLIVFILNRREFYKVGYEFLMMLTSTVFAYIVNKHILIKSEPIFNRPDDMRIELGFAVILSVYGLIKYLISNNIFQADVVRDKDKQKYILRKYSKLYKKYGEFVSESNVKIKAMVYAIMIFENFNRGRFKRCAERITSVFRNGGTYGIMQYGSRNMISDEDSIKLATEDIKRFYEESANEFGEAIRIKGVAYRYNQDARYVEDVYYIYKVLLDSIFANELIEERKLLYPDEDIIYCESIYELSTKLECNHEYIIRNQESDIVENVVDSRYFHISALMGQVEVILSNLNNVRINGCGSHFYSRFELNSVLRLENCNNVELVNFKFGHIKNVIGCIAPVIKVYKSKDVRIKNVKLYGCGTFGIEAEDSKVELCDSEIYECKYGAVRGVNSNIIMSGVRIHNCVTKNYDLIGVKGILNMNNVEIYNNTTEQSIINTSNLLDKTFKDVNIHDNIYATGYYMLEDEAGISLGNNTQKMPELRNFNDDSYDEMMNKVKIYSDKSV